MAHTRRRERRDTETALDEMSRAALSRQRHGFESRIRYHHGESTSPGWCFFIGREGKPFPPRMRRLPASRPIVTQNRGASSKGLRMSP